MKIRTQLVLACFVLSVLPLTVIVLYNHHSSKLALQSAYRQEAQRLARNMDRRLTTMRAELDERLSALSSITLAADATTGERPTLETIVTAMGDAAPLIDTLEYIPAAPPPPATPPPGALAEARPAPAVVPRATPDPRPRSSETRRVIVVDDLPDHEEHEESEEIADAQGNVAEPIVIDLPAVVLPRFELSQQAHSLMADIGRLSRELESSAAQMTREERDEKKRLLRDKSKILEREMEASRAKFQEQMKEAQRLREERRRRTAEQQRGRRARQPREVPGVAAVAPATAAVAPMPVVGVTPTPGVPSTGAAAPVAKVRPRSELSKAETDKLAKLEKQASLIFGRSFHVPIQKEGAVVGQIRAQLSTEEVVRRVLGGQGGDRDEIPFAVDREGNVYTRNPAERATIDHLGIPGRVKSGQPLTNPEGWIIVSSADEESGLRVGVARPVGESFVELRQTAARNFGYGLGLIAFALIGIVPLANHFTRDVKRVTAGAERIAQGDLQTRLPVKSKDEFGQLALAFNRMAEDLSENQRRLFEEERARREQEIQQRLLAMEYQRKTTDLEDARRFQLSMLPKEVPLHDRYDIAVFTKTATEVGGDYYDFHDGTGALSVTIGDATGHGAKAGTMVTVIKTLFAGYGGDEAPSSFLRDAAERIKRMDLGRMAMALSLARFDGDGVTVAAAGMPPMLIHRRRTSEVEEVALPATPLGTLGTEYAETTRRVEPGDSILLMTDGFPELLNSGGHQLGYPRAAEEFAAAAVASSDARGVIDALSTASHRWHGDLPPNDDITFVVVRLRA